MRSRTVTIATVASHVNDRNCSISDFSGLGIIVAFSKAYDINSDHLPCRVSAAEVLDPECSDASDSGFGLRQRRSPTVTRDRVSVSRACEDRGLEPFSADDVRGYRTGRHQGSLVDIQTKKELWVLAISTSAVPLMAGVAAFLIR